MQREIALTALGSEQSFDVAIPKVYYADKADITDFLPAAAFRLSQMRPLTLGTNGDLEPTFYKYSRKLP